MFSRADIAEYQVSSVLAWTDDAIFQSKNVQRALKNFTYKDEASRWILRCAIYHWLVSNNKLFMSLECKDLEDFIVRAVGQDLLFVLKELKSIRAIWEHDFDHLDGRGHYQRSFLQSIDLQDAGLKEDQIVAATQLIVDGGKLIIGGKLDFDRIATEVALFDDRLHAEWSAKLAPIVE